jgi:hypothetical protein
MQEVRPSLTLAAQCARANHRYQHIASRELVAAHTASQLLLEHLTAVMLEISALLGPK